ncbi:hypothetical protein [Marinobacter changyiensis]|uniref:hypothetical protein n=1 Tax=Marinobacter changyiensis TaxID=2604091 RepID=UPI0012649EA6|nr:hypothetical protein [Marinobacter changyiensis]
MEPIRPDDDELRAGTAQAGKPEQKKPTPERQAKSADYRKGPGRAQPRTPPPPPSGGGSGKGGSGKLVGLLVTLLVVSVAAGAGLVWQQAQRLAVLEEQVEEADYWVRQSKLTLARFEGDLTETGESLEQRGSTIEQRLTEQKDLIENANSEIRKLWVIANERNKKQLEEHAGQIAALKATMDGQAGSLTGLAEAQEGIKSDIGSLDEALRLLDGETDTLAANDARLQKQLATLVSEVDGLDVGIERSLQRFRQEQNLTIDGMESRLSALENTQENLSEAAPRINRAEARIASLEETIKSIDASRAQLTSRLVRLSEQVDALR